MSSSQRSTNCKQYCSIMQCIAAGNMAGIRASKQAAGYNARQGSTVHPRSAAHGGASEACAVGRPEGGGTLPPACLGFMCLLLFERAA